jgi:hypothetical protein
VSDTCGTSPPTPAPTPPPTPAPPTPPPSPGSCVGDADMWTAGYGHCVSYADGQLNHPYCDTDSDGTNGTSAKQVCVECGECTA